MVDLVGCASVEGLIGTVVVVPNHKERQFSTKILSAVRDQQLPSALALDRSDHPLDHGDATVLAHGTESRVNSPTRAPCPEALIDELAALIDNEMSRLRSGLPQGSSEKRSDCRGRRLLLEHGEPHNMPGVVINGDRDPPAERPALR